MRLIIENEVFSLIIAGTCIIVLIFILGTKSGKIVKKIALGIITGFGTSMFLYGILNLSAVIVTAVGLITFFATILLTKIK